MANGLGKSARDRHFTELGDLAYLNSASMGVPPASAVAALRTAVTDWAGGRGDFGRWEKDAERARERVAPLFGREPRDVALLPSYSMAASLVARALPDATVVVPEEEFRSNLMPWLNGRERVRLVPAPATTDAICAAIDGDTGLVAVSSVQSATGLRVDLPRLVAHAHANGTLVHVDASQSLGVDTTLATCGADFIGSVAYKWILGSRGAGFMAVRPEHRGRYAPAVLSPSAATDFADGALYGADYTLWEDARRFDQPQAWMPWIATAAGIEVVTSYDPAELEAHATGLATRFRDGAIRLGLTPGPVDVPSAIVAVTHPRADAAVARLTEAGVRASARGGGVRFAFHLYNTDDDVDRALAALG
jgi:selenocysteine lyase/cysteine desulfurase